MNELVIAVDFDGIICHSEYPNVDDLDYEVIELLKQLKEKGTYLILNTCRHGKPLQDAKNALISKGLVFDTYNENLQHRIELYGDCRKIGAHIYIDDRDICHDHYRMIHLLRNLIDDYDYIKNQYLLREKANYKY